MTEKLSDRIMAGEFDFINGGVRDVCTFEIAYEVSSLEHENATLAAGACIVPNGLLGDERGNAYCAIKRQRDMLLEALKANEAFVTEMVTFGGKYSFLNGTDIIPDAYAQLKRMSVAISAVEEGE